MLGAVQLGGGWGDELVLSRSMGDSPWQGVGVACPIKP